MSKFFRYYITLTRDMNEIEPVDGYEAWAPGKLHAKFLGIPIPLKLAHRLLAL